jgi:nitrogen fixation protein NifB
VTITINAVDPAVGENIYGWVRDGKKVLRGRQAAELLLARQLEGLKALKVFGVTAKINFILIPGVNDRHAAETAKVVRDLGADIFNIIPLIPAAESTFAEMEAPSPEMVERVRAEASIYLPQMKHCTRCRADAVGLLGEGLNETSIRDLKECARLPLKPVQNRPYVAAATMEGVLVNQHLGKSEEFRIFKPDGLGEYVCVETRKAPPSGGGDERWSALADVFYDCRAVLVNAAGQRPVSFLRSAGVEVIEMDGLIEQGLEHVFNGEDLPGKRMVKGCDCGQMEKKTPGGCEKKGCASSCTGSGMGCM